VLARARASERDGLSFPELRLFLVWRCLDVQASLAFRFKRGAVLRDELKDSGHRQKVASVMVSTAGKAKAGPWFVVIELGCIQLRRNNRCRREINGKLLHSLRCLVLHIVKAASKRHYKTEVLFGIILPPYVNDGSFARGVVVEAGDHQSRHLLLQIGYLSTGLASPMSIAKPMLKP
jgi:hypothetical protein